MPKRPCGWFDTNYASASRKIVNRDLTLFMVFSRTWNDTAYSSIARRRNVGGWWNVCNQNRSSLPLVLLLSWDFEYWRTTNIFPISSCQPSSCIRRIVDRKRGTVTEEISRVTFCLPGKKKTSFFQCHHLILGEICSFLDRPQRRHNGPTNSVLLSNASNTTILIIMTKPELVELNCHTFCWSPITYITTSKNATFCSPWNDFHLTIVLHILLQCRTLGIGLGGTSFNAPKFCNLNSTRGWEKLTHCACVNPLLIQEANLIFVWLIQISPHLPSGMYMRKLEQI